MCTKKKEAQEAIILADIAKIDAITESTSETKLIALHRELDGKYQSCINNWGHGMYGYYAENGFFYQHLSQSSLTNNLLLMKPRLEAFLHGWNTIKDPSQAHPSSDVSVTVNNNVIVIVAFEQARSKVAEMTYLTDEQTQELLDKITEIESVYKDGGNKKSKWKKVKPVLVWLADKSFDIGMTLLPLILKIHG